MRRGCASIAMTAAMMCSGVSRSAPTADATVQQPRAFGYVLGDRLTQRVLLSIDGDIPAPSAGRVGVWLERRQPRIEKDAQGRAWMVIEYQIVNAAPTLTQAEVPAFDLKSASGAALHVAAWPISIGALTPRASFRAGDLLPMRPDRLVMPENGEARRHRLMASLALLSLTLLSWLAWWSWRRREDARRLPFARAWRVIRAIDPANIDDNERAWIQLHRALDDTAGQVVTAASLPTLLSRAPFLEAFKPRLEAFYASSQQRFFGRDGERASFPLSEFARALYRAEKRQ